MRANKADRDAFMNAMASFASLYNIRADTVAARAGEWFKELRRYNLEDIKAGMEKVRLSDLERDRLPTCGQLEAAIKIVLREQEEERKRQEREKRDQRDRDEYVALLLTVPKDRAAQVEWVRQVTTPCERLRRRWLVESVRKGRTADTVLPAEEASVRFEDLWGAFEQQHDAAMERREAERRAAKTRRRTAGDNEERTEKNGI